MNITDIRGITTLLSQVNTISTSYEKVAQATGENFNIFSILGIEHYEEGTHSKFIAHLLNPKGQHGFGSKFLKLFLKHISDIDIDSSEENYRIKTEHSIGKINKCWTEGGKIDILMYGDRGNIIAIENKIYAEEQLNQLLRYKNAFSKVELLYLTLNGNESSQESSKEINYKRISYRNDIINWLEECQKVAFDNPVVRETIKQYKNLIKKLTHQNINSDMNKEITKLILNNQKSTESIINTVNSIRNKLVKNLDQIVTIGMGDEKLNKLNDSLKEINKLYHIPKVERFKYENRELVNFDLCLDKNNSLKTKNNFCFEFSNYDFGIKQKGWSHNTDIKLLVLDKFSDDFSEYPYSIDEYDLESIVSGLYTLIIKIAEYLNENSDKY